MKECGLSVTKCGCFLREARTIDFSEIWFFNVYNQFKYLERSCKLILPMGPRFAASDLYQHFFHFPKVYVAQIWTSKVSNSVPKSWGQ